MSRRQTAPGIWVIEEACVPQRSVTTGVPVEMGLLSDAD